MNQLLASHWDSRHETALLEGRGVKSRAPASTPGVVLLQV